MDLLKFVNYLSSQKNNASKATIKNYRADIGQFIRWFEAKFKKAFNSQEITPELIEIYKKSKNQDPSRKFSQRSLKRHLSSLRKFFHFLKTEGDISKNPLESASSKKDDWHLNEFRNQLYEYRLSSLTIKNYVIDIKQFLKWLEHVTGINNAWNVRDKNVFGKINETSTNEYKERLLGIGLSPKTINRKLSSLRKYLAFVQEQRLIKTGLQDLQIENEKPDKTLYSLSDQAKPESREAIAEISSRQVHSAVSSGRTARTISFENETKYSSFPPIRLLQKTSNGIIFIFDIFLVLPLANVIEQVKYGFWKLKGTPVFQKTTVRRSIPRVSTIPKSFYAPLSISTAYFPLHEKVWHYIRYTRPKWYKKYHSYTIAHYFHFAILVILMSAIGFTLYNNFINRAQNKSVLSALDSGSRILAFKGRLTDSLDNPINSPNTPIRAIIYNDPIATGSALVWQEVIGVNPNKEGVFETTLGTSIPIPPNMFFENSSLWLGISIGQTPELTPRQELALVSLAINAQTVQGLPPITSPDSGTRNVILALDSSGNLNIGGSATPVFQATGGQFTLSGKVLLLTTILGSNSDVAISPDGIGKIDLHKPLQNTSNNNNIPSAIGAVEVDDLFAVLATSSAQSAFTINQDGTGPIISASTSGTAKFTVENDGSIISAKGASWKPTLDAVSALNIASSSGIPFVTFDTLNSNIGIGTVIPQASLDIIGSFRTSGNVTLSKFTSNGGILYATKSGSLAQVNAGTITQCLMGGETPKFANCQASPYNNITEANGNIGIGITTPLFKLDIQDSQSASAAAQIFNTNTGTDADGLIVKLGNTSTTAVATSNHFVSFETSGIGIVGSIQGNGGKGVTYATSGPADFAEYFKKDENQTIEYGSLMCIDDKGFAVPCDNNNIKMIGIASEHPSFLGGESLGNRSIAVGLVGQVPVKVSTINGSIKPGDPLTYSNIPGVAIKAKRAGYIIGKALESCGLTKFSNEATPRTETNLTDRRAFVKYQNGVDSEGVEPSRPTFLRSAPKPSEPTPSILCEKVLTLVNVSWYDPDVYLASTGELKRVNQESGIMNNGISSSPMIHDSLFIIQDALGQAIEKIGTFSNAVIANLQVGFVKAEKITTDSIAIATESVTIAGVNIKDFISQTISETINSQLSTLNSQDIVSPIAKIDEVRTNLISPLAKDSNISISLHDSQFIIHDSNKASGSAVATIDSFGNASFSGTLRSEQLEVSNDATVGGTLRAKRILAESIEGLETKVSTLAAQYIQNTQNTQSASASDSQTVGPSDPSADGLLSSDSPIFPSVLYESLTASFATFTQGLMSFGPTSLAETAIAGPLYIQGTLTLANNSINVLGNDLEFQPSRQGAVSFLAGLVKIDENGNLKVGGNAEFAKDVAVKGNLVASGSATFSKLNLSLVQEALALSQTEIIATGSAGVAAIKANQTEVTILNKLITDKSLIYITPVGTPSAQSPFLMRQLPNEPSLSLPNGSFTVGVQTPSLQDILFNWLIVN